MKRFLLSRPVGNGIRGIILLAMLLTSIGYSGTDVAYAAAPANDDFDAAIQINSIEYHSMLDTTEATPVVIGGSGDDPDNIFCPDAIDPGKVLHYGFASVWYKYTPPDRQGISLNTFPHNGNITSYDTFIAVWTGTRGNLTRIACNDETSEGDSELSFIGNPGTTYYIEVAQFNDGLGGTTFFGGDLVFNAYITNTNVRVKGTLKARYFVPESGGLRRNLLNLSAGPVEIFNVANNQFIVSERMIYRVNNVQTSFSEMMGLPDNQLDTTYWLPWYNNKSASIDTQLRFGNVSNSTATVTVTIGGAPVPGSPFTLGVGASTRRTFPGIDRGPVKIQSNVPIVAAERVIYKPNGLPTSYSEMMALPNSQLDTIYWLPWYNNKSAGLDTQLRFANVSNTTATVTITIGGLPAPGSPFTLGVGASTRRTFPGIDRGPVKIQSNVPIIAAERVIYKVNNVPTSFSEMMALPNVNLSNIYWMSWYNNKSASIDTQLRFGNVSNSTATVHVTIGGVTAPGSPFTLGVGASTRRAFPGLDRGPVKIESNVPIVAAERVIYKVNNVPASFSEMMGLSNSLLDSRYWMPWYNNVDLDTQLRFALP